MLHKGVYSAGFTHFTFHKFPWSCPFAHVDDYFKIIEGNSCSFLYNFSYKLHFDFSDCLLLAKSLIIKCSETLSDLG